MRVLLAEDEDELRKVLGTALARAGYVVDAVADGGDALRHLATYEYGVCVVDWAMPEMSGLEVIEEARRMGNKAPFLMLTAKDAPARRVEALDAGADDYVIKPFDLDELLARLRALLRRQVDTRAPMLRCGNVTFEPTTRQLEIEGQVVALTPRELAVAEILLRKSPSLVTRRSLALHAWPDEGDAVSSNTIDVHIARLRGKLAHSDVRIETVRGSGYRIVPPVQ